MSERRAGVRFVIILSIIGALVAGVASFPSESGPAPRPRHGSANVLSRLNALSPADRAKLKKQVMDLGASGNSVQDESRSFSLDRAQALVERVEDLSNLGPALADRDAAAKAVGLLPAFKKNLSDFAIGKLWGDEAITSLERQETEIENLEGIALKGQHHAAAYRPEWPAPLPEGLVPSSNPEDWHSPEGISKVNTGWIIDQHMFDPDSPKTYPTLTSDFKHYDEGQNGMAMGHSDHPSANTMFGWVWQVQSFYWTQTTGVTNHPNASYCLFVMVSGDGGSTWFLYEIIYDYETTTSKDMINPKMAMDVSTYTTSETTYDRYYIAYEYCYSSTDHDVYVYSDNSTLKFYDGTAGGPSSPAGGSSPPGVAIATSASWEGNPTIASDYKTTETSYRVVAYEYAYTTTNHYIRARQSTGDGSTWNTAVTVSAPASGYTVSHPALTAGCSGSSFDAYMHLAYNFDAYTTSGTQDLLNPGFESGDNGNWTVRVTTDIDHSATDSHTGSYCADLGGRINFPSWPGDWIYQAVTIPPGVQSSTFSFYIRIATNEPSPQVAHDFFYADVRDTSGNLIQTLVILSNEDKDTYASYTQLTFDLSKYHGQAIRIYFWATNDATYTTSFFVDDTALNDGVYNTDSEVRYRRGAHSTADYPTDLAGFASVTVLPNKGGTTAWPYGAPAIAASYGGSTTITGGRVVIAADQFFPQDQPNSGDPARYQLKFAVNMCNGDGGTSCGNISPACTPNPVSLNWNAYYFYDNKDDYRFPSLVVDGVGWVQGTSTYPQNGIAYWPEIFMAYYIRVQGSSSPYGEAQMIVADASDEKCDGFASGAWYLFTAALQASDNDGHVVAKPGTLVTFNYFGGWPGLCFNKRLNHSGANVNDDVYFTTLGDNYTIDTTSPVPAPGGHIDAYWQFNGVSYVGPWTYPWPAGIEWDLTADATEIVNFRYYAFSAWSTGVTTPFIAIISDWCYYGDTSCPVTSINAIYGLGCLVSPPTVSNSVMVSRPGGIVTLGWNGPAQPTDVGQYTIWRGNNPTSASSYSVIGTTTNLTFPDTSAPDHLDCYIVVANCGPFSGPWGAYGQ